MNNGYTLGEAKLSSIRFAGAEVAESGSLDATNGDISCITKSDVTLAVPSGIQTITEDGYFDNIRLEGLGDIFEGRTRTVKVGTAPGYYTKMVCDGKTVSGGVIVLEDVSKDLEVSALYEFYDYPLPGVFTVADDGKGNVRKVKFARGNMWCQNGVLHNEEQYQFSREKWAELGHLSHFLWCRSLEESVKEKYRESRTTANDNFFTNTGDDHLSPNPNLVVNGQKGKWRVLSGSENGEWDYLLKKRITKVLLSWPCRLTVVSFYLRPANGIATMIYSTTILAYTGPLLHPTVTLHTTSALFRGKSIKIASIGITRVLFVSLQT